MSNKFDLIIVGSGFSSTFFLHQYLQKAQASSRVLVLKSGRHDSHSWQIQNRRNSSRSYDDFMTNKNPNRQWVFTVGFGGGSNCWWDTTDVTE